MLLDALPPGTVVADRGYESLALVERVAARGGEAHIPTQRRVRQKRTIPPDLYRRRSLLERFFYKPKQFRRIATRFEKTRNQLPRRRCPRVRKDMVALN